MSFDKRRCSPRIGKIAGSSKFYQDLMCETLAFRQFRLLHYTQMRSILVTPRPARCPDQLPERWQPPRHLRHAALVNDSGGLHAGGSRQSIPLWTFQCAWPKGLAFGRSAFSGSAAAQLTLLETPHLVRASLHRCLSHDMHKSQKNSTRRSVSGKKQEESNSQISSSVRFENRFLLTCTVFRTSFCNLGPLYRLVVLCSSVSNT